MSDYELVPYDINKNTRFVIDLCENICERVNKDIQAGYEGPSPETLQILEDYCADRDFSFRSYSPGAYDAAVRQSLINTLANFCIEDSNLLHMMSELDMNAFFEKEKQRLGDLAEAAFKHCSKLTYVFQHQDAFLQEAEEQLKVPKDELRRSLRNGFLPEVKIPHTPGIYLEEKENSADIAVLLYAYTMTMHEPEKEVTDKDPLKWWKDLCNEAELLAMEHCRPEPEPEPDMGIDF